MYSSVTFFLSLYALKNAVMVKTYHSALVNLTFEGRSVQIPEVMPGFLVRFCRGFGLDYSKCEIVRLVKTLTKLICNGFIFNDSATETENWNSLKSGLLKT